MSSMRRQFEKYWEESFSNHARNAGAVILMGTPMQILNRRKVIPFNPLFLEEDKIEPVQTPQRPSGRKKSASLKGASSPAIHRTLRFHATETVAYKKYLIKTVRQLIQSK